MTNKREVNFNINEMVKVKLTPKGVGVLREKHRELNYFLETRTCATEGLGPFKLKLDSDGYYKTQLWSLMEDFGEYMGITRELVFETNIILVKEFSD